MAKQRKFKNQIVEKIKAEEKERVHQEELHKKYNVDEEVVVIEKSNTFKFITNTLIGLIRFLAAAIVFILAIIGLVAIIYPEPREALLIQGQQTLEELKQLLTLK